MGNCQAVDAAALVIQHPSGKQERMYWPVTASEVMKMNPGCYVSLIIPILRPVSGEISDDQNKTVRVKLLRPNDTLLPGRAYRLLKTQEVMKVLKAKKHARTKKNQSEESSENMQTSTTSQAVLEKNNSAIRQERHQQRSGNTNPAQGRHKSCSWRPSLQSISECAS